MYKTNCARLGLDATIVSTRKFTMVMVTLGFRTGFETAVVEFLTPQKTGRVVDEFRDAIHVDIRPSAVNGT